MTPILKAVIAGRFAAGELIASLADDYELAPEQIEDALRAVIRASERRNGQGLLMGVYRRLVAQTETGR